MLTRHFGLNFLGVHQKGKNQGYLLYIQNGKVRNGRPLVKYLPSSPVTSIVLSFGEASITKKNLNDAFLNYISQTERDTLVSALKKENFDGELFDDLLDFLDRFSCTQKPTPENLETLINNIAHKELTQSPKYATDNKAIGCQECMLSHIS